jgi:hypothetical protein
MVFRAVVTTSASSATMNDATDVSTRTHARFAFSVGSFIVDLRHNAWGDRIGVAPTALRRMAAGKGCVEIIFHRPHPLGGPKRLGDADG